MSHVFGRGQVGVVELFASVRGDVHIEIRREFAHLLGGDARPVACNHGIYALMVLREVEGDLGELRQCATLQKQDFVVAGNVHQAAQVLLGVVQDAEKGIGAVRHRHHGYACAVVVQHFLLGGAQYASGRVAGPDEKL